MFQKKNLTLLGLRPRPRINSQKYLQTIKKKCFLPHFYPWAGGKTPKPHKKHFFCVRHAEGMRACTHGAKHRSDSVARSTPTAQQERP